MPEEYIKRSDAEKAIREYADIKHNNGDITIANCVLKTVSVLKEIPAANVAEVVHGEWIGDKNKQVRCSHLFVYDDWRCSICGLCYPESHFDYLGKYCPNCGAKMEERLNDLYDV